MPLASHGENTTVESETMLNSYKTKLLSITVFSVSILVTEKEAAQC